MKKTLIALIIFSSTVSLLFGQERITLTTTKPVNSTSNQLRLTIDASAADRSGVWVDLNNNGVRDGGEEVKAWNSAATYVIQSQTITVYGKVTVFNGAAQGLTALDLTQNPHLIFLRIDDNLIEELDLSAQGKDLYNLHISKNRISGVLDVSKFEALQTMNVDRNFFTSIVMGNHPKLGQNINISRNLLNEAAIDAVMAKVPNRTGTPLGNFYLIDTRTADPQYEEGNQLKQHHLDHQIFTSYNWRALDVNGTFVLRDIGRLANRSRTAFTTAKSAGGSVTINISAQASDQPGVWVDLNNNGTKDGNEAVTVFGTDVSYMFASSDISVYGLASGISVRNNELTKFDASKNPYLDELNISVNSLIVAELHNAIEKLVDRTSTTPGTLTLLDFAGDGNQVISEHISKANAKNWVVKDVTGRTLSPSDIVILKQTIRDLSDMATYPGQVITLPELTDQRLVVTYSIEAGKEALAKLEGNVLTSLGYGEVMLTATQAGNELYEAFSATIKVTIMPAGETFKWLGVPSIGVIGNNAIIAGPRDLVSQFTKFYINDVLVQSVDGNVDLTDHKGNLKLKATNQDGTQIIRLFIER